MLTVGSKSFLHWKKVLFFKNILSNVSSELVGIVPHPNLVHAVAINVRHTRLFFSFACFPQLTGKKLD